MKILTAGFGNNRLFLDVKVEDSKLVSVVNKLKEDPEFLNNVRKLIGLSSDFDVVILAFEESEYERVRGSLYTTSEKISEDADLLIANHANIGFVRFRDITSNKLVARRVCIYGVDGISYVPNDDITHVMSIYENTVYFKKEK